MTEIARSRLLHGFGVASEGGDPLPEAARDEHQVRTWTSWRRWTLLAMLAHAFLTVLAATQPEPEAEEDGLIALTRNEIRRLFSALTLAIDHPISDVAHRLHWSRWRR